MHSDNPFTLSNAAAFLALLLLAFGAVAPLPAMAQVVTQVPTPLTVEAGFAQAAVAVDAAALGTLQAGDTFETGVLDGLTATVDAREDRPGGFTLFATPDADPLGHVVVTVEDGYTYLIASAHGRQVRVEPVPGRDALYRASEALETETLGCLPDTSGTASATGFEPQGTPAAAVTVDILYAATREFAQEKGSRLGSFFQQQLDEANAALRKSQVDHRFRLAGVVESSASESGKIKTDYSHLADASDGWADDVLQALRAKGADAAHLYVSSGDDYCGMAGLYDARNPIAVTKGSSGCMSKFTGTHELGHTMGLSHEKEESSSGVLPYSHGFASPGGAFRTLMAYGVACGESPNTSCPRTLAFASPDLRVNGVTAGDRNVADAARALRELTPRVAGYAQPTPQSGTLYVKSIAAQPTTVAAGGDVRIDVEVCGNVGTTADIAYYVTDGQNLFTQIGDDRSASLDDDCDGENMTYAADLAPGTYQILARVDPDHRLPDDDRGDNLKSVTITVTGVQVTEDLSVGFVTVTPNEVKAGEEIVVSTEACGTSTTRTRLVYELVQSGGQVQELGDDRVGELAQNCDAEDQRITLGENVPAGTHQIRVRVDADNEVAETDENNNVATASLVVTSPATHADIYVSYVRLSASEISPGSSFKVETEVCGVAPKPSRLTYDLIGPDGVTRYIAQDLIKALRDECGTADHLVTIPENYTAGIYTVRVTANSDKAFVDTNPANDVKSAQVEVKAPTPDSNLWVERLSIVPSTVEQGGAFKVTAFVCGRADAPTLLRYTLLLDQGGTFQISETSISPVTQCREHSVNVTGAATQNLIPLGTHSLVVRANADASLRETTLTDNAATAPFTLVPANGNTVEVSLPTVKLSRGQSTTVALRVGSSPVDITAAELTLRYDALVISVTRVEAGSAAQGAVVVPNLSTPGEVRVALAATEPIKVPGDLLVLHVQAVGAGDTDLALTARLNNGVPFARTVTGHVEVADCPSICGDADENGVVGAADATRILQHVVGLASVVPCVGDVNGDGGIGATDAVDVLKKVVGLIPSLSCAAPEALAADPGPAAQYGAGSALRLTIPDTVGTVGDTLRLALRVSPGVFSSFELALYTDAEVAEVVGVQPGALIRAGLVVHRRAGDTTHVAFASATPVSGPGSLLLVDVVLRAPSTSSVRASGKVDGSQGALEVTQGRITAQVATPVATSPRLAAPDLRLSPNPSREHLVVEYRLDTLGPVDISVYDVLGRRVASVHEGHEAAGPHEVRARLDALPAGTYVVRLDANGEVITRLLVIVR